MKDYLNNSFEKSMKERKEYYLYDIPVHLLNKLPEHINIDNILEEVKELIPYDFLSDLEGIYIGEFPELKNRKIQAMVKDSAIYLSSYEEFPEVTEDTIVNDIVHEVAHLLEDKAYFEIYNNNLIEKEYIGKKKRLIELLRANNISFPGMGTLFFSEDYVDELDDFLFNNLGYDNLSILIAGLFLSPYSVVSVREYFATGFEEYIKGDSHHVEEICPALYAKIKILMETD